MPLAARVDVEKIMLTFMDCLKLPQVADMISCAQAEKKNKNDEKKYNDTDDGGNRIFLLRAK